MSLSDLASIGSLVSGIAVLVSLVYLSQQTKQNSKHTRALIHQGRIGQTSNYLALFAADASLAEVAGRGFAGDEMLSDTQITRFHMTQISQFLTIEDLYFQHREGLVADSRHSGMIRTLRGWFATPGFRASWTIARANFDTEFQDFMDGFMMDIQATSTPALGPIWKSLFAEERSKAVETRDV